MLSALQSYSVVSGYYGQIPAPSSSVTVVVIDTALHAVYTVLSEPATSCVSMPCLNGGKDERLFALEQYERPLPSVNSRCELFKR